MRVLKPATTADEQIALLRARGMNLDEAEARQWLENVSYYRLSAYWYPARDLNAESESFRPGADFRDVVSLYEADRKLRTLIHDAIERIEITMRTRIGERFIHTDPLFHENLANFRPSFDHDRWLNLAEKRVDRAGNHNESIRHYRSEYGGRFPFWVLAEVLDFADVSRLFDGLLVADQRFIAESLGFTINIDALSANQQRKVRRVSPLARWLEQLTIIRNACAHHARLWNKSFTPAPTEALRTNPDFALLPEGQSERIFGAILVMGRFLEVTSPGSSWSSKIADLLNTDFLINPLVEAESLGIPDGWEGSFKAS